MIKKTKYLSVVISLITLTTSIGIGADLPRSTPYIITVTLTFSEDEVRYNAEANVGFGPTREPERVGKAE